MSTATETTPHFLDGARDCVPTLLGYISIGFAAGMVGAAAQLSVAEIGLLAALVYAGASQFIICAMLAAASPATAIIATAFLVNLRHFLMSAALAPHFSAYSLARSVGIGLLLTDESFGVASTRLARGLRLNDRWMYGLNVTAYLTWIAACIAGGWLGSWIGDPHKLGLDFALTAMFVALLAQQLHTDQYSLLKRRILLALGAAVGVALLSTFVSPPVAVLLSTMLVAAIGAVTER